MKAEPYQIASIIGSQQQKWSISKASGVSESFTVGDTFYVKISGAETYYAITLTESGF